MNFEEWYEEARTKEPYLNRGISQRDIWEAATKAEREACAKVCEAVIEDYRGSNMGKCAEVVGDKCVDAIRERSNDKLRGATDEPRQ